MPFYSVGELIPDHEMAPALYTNIEEVQIYKCFEGLGKDLFAFLQHNRALRRIKIDCSDLPEFIGLDLALFYISKNTAIERVSICMGMNPNITRFAYLLDPAHVCELDIKAEKGCKEIEVAQVL